MLLFLCFCGFLCVNFLLFLCFVCLILLFLFVGFCCVFCYVCMCICLRARVYVLIVLHYFPLTRISADQCKSDDSFGRWHSGDVRTADRQPTPPRGGPGLLAVRRGEGEIRVYREKHQHSVQARAV